MSGDRLAHAVSAYLRQEFGASVVAIVGFLDILIEDARRSDLADFLPDLEQMRRAAVQLSSLVTDAVDLSETGNDAAARLRHELRTPLNAIKGYGELLVEEACDSGRQAVMADLSKVLDLAGSLLGEVDRLVETAAAPAVDIVTNVLRAIEPIDGDYIPHLHVVASKILVVDDNASNRELLSRRLLHEGYKVTTADSGVSALSMTATETFDLVLLDLMMPEMSGFEVLSRLKAAESTRHIPVIMISALDELDSAVRCIEAGAEDYLPKPFNPVLLRVRIAACLDRKRLVDQLRAEKERSEALLLNMLPRRIVERIRRGETVIADHVAEATILFADLVDFSSLAARLTPQATVNILGLLFSRFDALAAEYGVEKIKTIGDGYVVAGGLPDTRVDHAVAVAEMAVAMLDAVTATGRATGTTLGLRVGIHTGSLVAGVIGTRKFVYDVWGDTVNTAKRMESSGVPGRVHVSTVTKQALGNTFRFDSRGPLEVKGKGLIETYLLYRHD